MCPMICAQGSILRVPRQIGRFRLLAVALLTVFVASPLSAQATLDFSTVTRSASGVSPNQVFTFTGTFMGSGGETLGVTMVVAQGGSLGTFRSGVTDPPAMDVADSPYKDGEIADGGDGVTFFGLDSQTDLGVLFDPSFVMPAVTSPLTITLTFEGGADVGGLSFLITDIDSSGLLSDFRRDRVEIVGTNDVGSDVQPTLAAATIGVATFAIETSSPPIGAAQALGTRTSPTGAMANTDNGNLSVTFPGERIRSVVITYSDMGGESDPAERGIGVLANLTIAEPVPVELMSFSIE